MRWSQLYTPTLRQDPAEADAASHRLLVRAGYLRQLAAGHYSLLPLAVRVRAKVMEIVREELGLIGAQEFLLPAMHPAEIWRLSGRYDSIGPELFRLKDRKGAEQVLGLTHEEIFTDLAGELGSYKQLPQIWYQFQTKFRDEARPKSGLLRVREFTMKDSYSFDLDEAGLDVSFERHRAAYEAIFERLGIPAIAVEASSGSMGGSSSVEFMCPAEAGEDLVVTSPCGYAANVEKATSRLAEITDGAGELARFATPKARTIDELAVQHGIAAERQVKTLVHVLDGELTLILMRGDHALAEQKLLDLTGAVEARPATVQEIVGALGASPGSLGAVGVTGIPVIADEALRGRRDLATGANEDGFHYSGVDVERDLPVGRWADLREVGEGESCVRCGEPLEIVRTIEVGHIFKLGTKYTEALGVRVLGPDGERITPVMGCYGIGIERAMAVIVERNHDERGIVWPESVAPFRVAIAQLTPEAAEVCEDLYRELPEAIWDDRDERPGAKFKDIELVGIPFRITVGKGLARGVVEITTRATGETVEVPVAEAAERLRAY